MELCESSCILEYSSGWDLGSLAVACRSYRGIVGRFVDVFLHRIYVDWPSNFSNKSRLFKWAHWQMRCLRLTFRLPRTSCPTASDLFRETCESVFLRCTGHSLNRTALLERTNPNLDGRRMLCIRGVTDREDWTRAYQANPDADYETFLQTLGAQVDVEAVATEKILMGAMFFATGGRAMDCATLFGSRKAFECMVRLLLRQQLLGWLRGMGYKRSPGSNESMLLAELEFVFAPLKNIPYISDSSEDVYDPRNSRDANEALFSRSVYELTTKASELAGSDLFSLFFLHNNSFLSADLVMPSSNEISLLRWELLFRRVAGSRIRSALLMALAGLLARHDDAAFSPSKRRRLTCKTSCTMMS